MRSGSGRLKDKNIWMNRAKALRKQRKQYHGEGRQGHDRCNDASAREQVRYDLSSECVCWIDFHDPIPLSSVVVKGARAQWRAR